MMIPEAILAEWMRADADIQQCGEFMSMRVDLQERDDAFRGLHSCLRPYGHNGVHESNLGQWTQGGRPPPKRVHEPAVAAEPYSPHMRSS